MAPRLYLNEGRDKKLVCCINSHQHLKILTAFIDRASFKFQPSLRLDDHRQSLTFRQKIVDLEFYIQSFSVFIMQSVAATLHVTHSKCVPIEYKINNLKLC